MYVDGANENPLADTILINEMHHDKPTKQHLHPLMTQISSHQSCLINVLAVGCLTGQLRTQTEKIIISLDVVADLSHHKCNNASFVIMHIFLLN